MNEYDPGNAYGVADYVGPTARFMIVENRPEGENRRLT
jgi:hypothetical protein